MVAAGANHSCGLRTNGQAACWGLNTSGQASPPTGTFTSLSVSANASACGVRTNGTAVCWGSGQGSPPAGRFDSSAPADRTDAARLPSAGSSARGGDNEYGERTIPKYTSIAAGEAHGCGLLDEGHASAGGPGTLSFDTVGPRCWGSDAAGQSSPPQAAGVGLSSLGFAGIDAGGDTTCALDNLGAGSGPIVDC